MDTFCVKFQLGLTVEQIVKLRRVMEAQYQTFPNLSAQTEQQALRYYIRSHVTERLDEILDKAERRYRVLSGDSDGGEDKETL